MKRLVTTLVLSASSLACASEPSAFTPPSDHPASANAREAPPHAISTTLLVVPASDTSHTDTPPPGEPTDPYTCPMHSEVGAKTPGLCPKCGMHLVKKPEHEHGAGGGE